MSLFMHPNSIPVVARDVAAEEGGSTDRLEPGTRISEELSRHTVPRIRHDEAVSPSVEREEALVQV